MKRKIGAIILFLALCGAAGAASVQTAFDEANRLYTEGKYTAALEQYRELAGACPHWKVYFNEGNACFKLGRYLDAKILYLKARKLKPVSRPIAENIQVVNRRFLDKIPPSKNDFFSDIYLRLDSWIPDDVLLALLIGLALAGNLCLFLRLQGRKSRPLLYGIIVCLLTFALLAAFLALRSERRGAVANAVVKRESAELRSGPGQGNTVLFKVNPGLELRILEWSGDWIQVFASDQIAGWIEAGAVELI